MALIGDSIRKEVLNQIDTRQQKWAAGTRGAEEINALNSNAWIRLASSVDITNADAPDWKREEINGRLIQLKEYFGSIDNLAQNVVITGGTAKADKNVSAETQTVSIPSINQRYGINRATGGSYNIAGLETAYGMDGSAFGYRPMPGLESATVSFYNRGTLSKAEIRLTVNSPQQLSLIEILYLRPGYSILLEWGHNSYFNNNGDVNHATPITDAFVGFFTKDQTRASIQKSIEKDRESTNYNYDGFLGIITNFQWTLNESATYSVVITAISQGAVVESLKVKTKPLPPPQEPPVADESTTTTEEDEETTSAPEPPKTTLDEQYAKRNISVIHEVLYDIDLYLSDYAQNMGREVGAPNAEVFMTKAFANSPTNFRNFVETRTITDLTGTEIKYKPKADGMFVAPVSAGQDSSGVDITDYLYYITFDYFLMILELQNSIYASNDSKQALVYMDLGPKPMLTIPGTISPDPSVCLVAPSEFVSEVIPASAGSSPKLIINTDLFNPSQARYTSPTDLFAAYASFGDFNEILDEDYKELADLKTLPPSGKRIKPRTGKRAWDTLPVDSAASKDKSIWLRYPITTEFVGQVSYDATSVSPINGIMEGNKEDSFTGYLDNVYLNTSYLMQCIENNTDKKGEISVIALVQTVLDGVSETLGGINKFVCRINDSNSTLEIVDENTWGTNRKPDPAFITYGVKPGQYSTFIKSLSISTTLSKEFASMISIGAQANGNKVGSNSTAFSQFNLGLVDRTAPEKEFAAQADADSYAEFYIIAQKLWDNLLKIYPVDGDNTLNNGRYNITDAVANAKALYKDYANFIIGHFSNAEKTIPAPFFIPFEMNVGMKGLAGVKIYDQFKADNILLPASYQNTVNFLIKDLKHEIKDNEWETQITALTVPALAGSATIDRKVSKQATVIEKSDTGARTGTTSSTGNTSDRYKNYVFDKYDNLIKRKSQEIIEGVGLPCITSTAQGEYRKWNGKKENNPDVLPYLVEYWSTRGVTLSGAAKDAAKSAADELPWSAACVSWIMRQCDPDFPAGASHYKYVQAADQGKGGYRTFPIPETKQIVAQVGDILVKPRTGTSTDSHGDIIWKIENDIAYMVGGNVGNTLGNTTIKLIDGYIVKGDIGDYLLVVKKME